MKNILSKIGNNITNGIKYIIPLIVLYSILLVLINWGIIKTVNFDVSEFVFMLIVPVLTAFIANDITNKVVFIPGLVLGYFSHTFGLGFLGGIIGGLVLGYIAKIFCSHVKIKREVFSTIFGYLVVGGLSLFISYLAILFIVKPGILFVLNEVTTYINSIDVTQVVLLVGILSALTVVDLGGPFNKLAYSFIIAFYMDGYYHVTGPVLISVALPPIALLIATRLMRNRFSEVDLKSKNIMIFGSLFGLTEGALPIAYRRPLIIIPPLLVGSITASCYAAYFGMENELMISSIIGLLGTNNLLVYVSAYGIGVVVILILLFIIIPSRKVLKK